jgi:ABC-2 type transport system permease protein
VLHLVFKDFHVNRKYFLLIIVVAGMVFFTDQISGVVIPIIMITYGMLSRSCYNDDLDRGDVFLRTLPIKPSTIVFSKYLFGICVVALALLPYALLAIGGSFRAKSNIDTMSLAISILTISLMYCVYLPVYFKYGYMKARTFQTILYVGLALVSVAFSSMIEAVKRSIPMSQGQWLLIPLNRMAKFVVEKDAGLLAGTMIISAILLASSALLSLRLYKVGRD